MQTPLLNFQGGVEPGEQAYALYARRWWLLFLLSMGSMQTSVVWMTWSPIVDLVQQLYGWSTATIDLMAAWGPLLYVAISLAIPGLVEKFGLRACITIGCTLTLVGATVRSITTQSPYALVLAHIGKAACVWSQYCFLLFLERKHRHGVCSQPLRWLRNAAVIHYSIHLCIVC
jgi:hypothetical protein